jgi:hypothetical protein
MRGTWAALVGLSALGAKAQVNHGMLKLIPSPTHGTPYSALTGR